MTNLPMVLGVHPSSRGFGWALFEGPLTLFDCGSVEIHGDDKNGQTWRQIARLLDKYRPPCLVLEAFDAASSHRKPRIRVLYRILIACAEHRGIAVHRYARAEIAFALGIEGASQRQAVAEAVASRIEALRSRLPRPKKIWLGERHHMGLFCAVACVLTHYDRAQALPTASS